MNANIHVVPPPDPSGRSSAKASKQQPRPHDRSSAYRGESDGNE